MGKASTAAQNRYIAKTYDRINFVVKKGKKETIKAAAKDAGESINEYIEKSVTQRMLGQLNIDNVSLPRDNCATIERDEIELDLSPEDTAKIKAAADAAGETVESYILTAVDQRMNPSPAQFADFPQGGTVNGMTALSFVTEVEKARKLDAMRGERFTRNQLLNIAVDKLLSGN